MPDAASVAVEATPGAKLPNEERRFLEVAEAKTLLACLTGHRLEALFVVYLGLGLRRGEALGLDWKDVDLEKGEVTISRSLQRLKKKGQAGKLVFQTPKTATSDRIVSLPAFVLSSFLNHKERQALERGDAGEAWREHGLVFTTAIGTPIEPRNVLRTFHQLLGTVKIPKHRLHDLRHTAAAMMLSQGVELNAVKAIRGHASIAITDHFYGKLPQSALRAAAEKVNGLFSSPSGLATGLATAAPPKRLN